MGTTFHDCSLVSRREINYFEVVRGSKNWTVGKKTGGTGIDWIEIGPWERDTLLLDTFKSLRKLI